MWQRNLKEGSRLLHVLFHSFPFFILSSIITTRGFCMERTEWWRFHAFSDWEGKECVRAWCSGKRPLRILYVAKGSIGLTWSGKATLSQMPLSLPLKNEDKSITPEVKEEWSLLWMKPCNHFSTERWDSKKKFRFHSTRFLALTTILCCIWG